MNTKKYKHIFFYNKEGTHKKMLWVDDVVEGLCGMKCRKKPKLGLLLFYIMSMFCPFIYVYRVVSDSEIAVFNEHFNGNCYVVQGLVNASWNT